MEFYSIVIKEVEADKAICFNSAMIKSAHKPKKREKFLNDIQEHNFLCVIKRYCETNIFIKVFRKMRRIIKV